MLKTKPMLWSLIFALAMSGCATNGRAVCPPPVSPQKLAPVPAELMLTPDYVKQASAVFLESSEPAKPTTKASRPY